jgi:hypothetical protein
VNLTADHRLVDLMIRARDRLVVDCWANDFVDGGVMVAVFDPKEHQQDHGSLVCGSISHEFFDGISRRLHGC